MIREQLHSSFCQDSFSFLVSCFDNYSVTMIQFHSAPKRNSFFLFFRVSCEHYINRYSSFAPHSLPFYCFGGNDRLEIPVVHFRDSIMTSSPKVSGSRPQTAALSNRTRLVCKRKRLSFCCPVCNVCITFSLF